MRVSRAGLLVAIAFTVPVVVELRTVLAYFDVGLSLAGSLALALVAVAVLVLWAVSDELLDRERPNGS